MKTLKMLIRKRKVAIFLSIFVILSSFLISTAATAASNAEDRLIVDIDLCIGCRNCEEIAPNVFIIVDGKAVVMVGWQYYPITYIEAMEQCPMEAIYLDNY